MTQEGDPGWPIARSFLPPSRRGPANALVLTRAIWIAFFNAILLFGFVLAFTTSHGAKKTAWPWAVGALVVAAIAEVARTIAERPLDCSSPTALLGSWRSRFFVRMACGEVSALVAFFGALVSNQWWVFPVGAVPTLLAFGRAAPTTAHLNHDTQALAAAGCGLDVFEVFTTPPGPTG